MKRERKRKRKPEADQAAERGGTDGLIGDAGKCWQLEYTLYTGTYRLQVAGVNIELAAATRGRI